MGKSKLLNVKARIKCECPTHSPSPLITHLQHTVPYPGYSSTPPSPVCRHLVYALVHIPAVHVHSFRRYRFKPLIRAADANPACRYLYGSRVAARSNWHLFGRTERLRSCRQIPDGLRPLLYSSSADDVREHKKRSKSLERRVAGHCPSTFAGNTGSAAL